ncbi:MAG TPA: TolC family protein, partial [Candidatus Barnesiella excrementipullorum]|nr:TolC family protein [Candidatus Barnesiella excrementipullorum]
MNLRRIATILSVCTAMAAMSQESSEAWSLKQCIEYAHTHNISIGQSRLSVERSAVDLHEAKEELFPSLSFSTSHDYSQSPYADNPTESAAIYNGSYRISASWTLFDGGQRYYNIKSNRLARQEQ